MRISDRALITASLIVSGIGIAGLIALHVFTEPPETGIEDAKMLEDGASITIKGVVQEVRQGASTTHFVIKQECGIDATVFELVNVTPGTTVDVAGEMDTYQGKRSLLVESMKLSS